MPSLRMSQQRSFDQFEFAGIDAALTMLRVLLLPTLLEQRHHPVIQVILGSHDLDLFLIGQMLENHGFL